MMGKLFYDGGNFLGDGGKFFLLVAFFVNTGGESCSTATPGTRPDDDGLQ